MYDREMVQNTYNIPLIKMPHALDLPMPVYATEHSVGVDLRAAIDSSLYLLSGERTLIPTGIAIALPVRCEAQIRSRSGLSLNYGLAVLNSPGTIDTDYRGEIKVILINHGQKPFVIHRGDKIAQMVIAPYIKAHLNLTKTLPKLPVKASDQERGDKGFGSTGLV